MQLITDPNINCGQCYKLKLEAGTPPCCETSHGCPVDEDLITDPYLGILCNSYMRDRVLYNITEDPAINKRLCENFGLYENPDLHLKLESLFAKWQRKQRDERNK